MSTGLTPDPSGYAPYHTEDDGTVRFTGCRPSPPHLVGSMPTYAEMGLPTLPESMWAEFDYNDPALPVEDQDSRGACFPYDTVIRQSGGLFIGSIKPGQQVVTAEGSLGTVVRTFSRLYNGDLVGLVLGTDWSLSPTPNHKILTRRGYVPAGDLNDGDWLAVPRRQMDTKLSAYLANLTDDRFDPGNEQWAWIKPLARERLAHRGPVYNFEVGVDHSYVAEGIGVANCNGHAAAKSLEMERSAAGMPFVHLSPWFVYAHLCGGIDSGSSIAEALDFLRQNGTCPFEEVPYGTINPRAIPAAAASDAPRFKIEQGVLVETFAQMASACMLMRAMNAAVHAGPSFSNLDPEGVPSAGVGFANHAITIGWGLKKSTRHGWLIKMRNSWAKTWGLNGFCWLSEANLSPRGFEGYCVGVVSEDPNGWKVPSPLLRSINPALHDHAFESMRFRTGSKLRRRRAG